MTAKFCQQVLSGEKFLLKVNKLKLVRDVP